MSKILVVAEHEGGKLNPSAPKKTRASFKVTGGRPGAERL